MSNPGTNLCVPLFDPADRVTVEVGVGGVGGKRFVTLTGALDRGMGQPSASVVGGTPTGVFPAAGAPVFGVASQDGAVDDDIAVYCHGVVPVVAGAALAAGTLCQTDATGAAVPWDGTLAHRPAGLVVADTAIGADAPISLRRLL